MALEREIKLAASPGFQLPPFDGLADGVTADPAIEKRIETVYHDTDDLRLARWGCSLRHRAGEGWTLKLPGEGDGAARNGVLERRELEFPAGRTVTRPPAAALSIVAAYLRGAEVKPVARLSTWRRKVRIQREGRLAAEVVDDEVSILEGRRVAARYREVEVELIGPDDPELATAILDRLRLSGAGQPDPTPKHVRALGPRSLAPPDVVPPPLGESPALGEVFASVIAAAVTALLRHDPGIRVDGDAEDVHQARVATRRARSHLRTFKGVLDPAVEASLKEELGWLAAELGRVRDLEVQSERLQRRAAMLPAVDAQVAMQLVEDLQRQAIAAREVTRTVLRSQRYLDLVEQMVAVCNVEALAGAAPQPAVPALHDLVDRQWRRLRRAVRMLPPVAADEQLHEIRILAKRARYAAEAAALVAGRDAARFATALAGVQEVLGEHQDAVTAQQWLRDHAGRGRRAFAAGQLSMLEGDAAAAARARFPKAWKDCARRAWD